MRFKQMLHAFGMSAILLLTTSIADVNASTIGIENSTLTTFNANTGDLTFDWDQNSQYDITGTSVELFVDNIVISGPSVVGTLYEFVIPNFYDPLPLKKIEITMIGANSGASGFDLPGVLDIIGADSDYDQGGPALPVYGVFVQADVTSTRAIEYWEMRPNPDFEIVKLYVPVGFELQSISIATQSTVVPMPASTWLFGSGLLGMIAIARRRWDRDSQHRAMP